MAKSALLKLLSAARFFLLEKRGVHIRSVTDAIDTSTPAGRFFFHVMASLAQMERELLLERTRAGLDAAKVQGRVGGRKPKMTPSKTLKRRSAAQRCGDKSGCIRADPVLLDSVQVIMNTLQKPRLRAIRFEDFLPALDTFSNRIQLYTPVSLFWPIHALEYCRD